MSLTVEEKEEIKRYVLEETDRRYVGVMKCTDLQRENDTKFANDDARIKLFEQKMNAWEWMFKLIATGTVGTFVASILSLILK